MKRSRPQMFFGHMGIAGWPVLVFLAVFVLGCGGSPELQEEKQGAGRLADADESMELSLDDLDGTTLQLKSLRGQFVLVNYFGSWHPPCISELNRLNSLVQGEGAVSGLKVVAIALDVKPRHSLPKVITSVEPGFPILLADKAALDGRTPFGKLPAVPTSYLLDREGRLKDSMFGAVPVEYVRRRIRELSKDEQ